MLRLTQPSFARGEIAPDLYGRTDVAPYKVALRTALNVIIHAYGGASNRPGLRFVAPCISPSYKSRLIEFQYNTTDTYILEFGDSKMRVIRDDAHVLEAAKAITGVSQANPPVVSLAAHGYANGADIYIDGIVGMTALNRRWFKVASVATDTFALTDQQTGANIDSTAYAAYVSGGTASKVYEIATPYVAADLEILTYVQSANKMTLTRRGYAPRELSRHAHDDWSLDIIAFAPSQVPPTGVVATANSTGAVTYNYQVTSVNSETQEESLPAGASLSNGVATTSTMKNTVTFTAGTGATKCSVYRQQNGIYGFIGDTETGSFVDNNITPNVTITPPKARNPFNTSSITSVSITNAGTGYTSPPSLIVSDTTGTGALLSCTVSGGHIATVTIEDGGSGYSNPSILINSGTAAGGAVHCTTVPDGLGFLSSKLDKVWVGASGTGYVHPVATVLGGGSGASVTLQLTNGEISGATLVAAGNGYSPTATIAVTDTTPGSGGVLTPHLTASQDYPGAVTYYEQRRVFGDTDNNPDTNYYSAAGSAANMSFSSPAQADDAITATLNARQVNEIRGYIPGNDLIIFTAGAEWRVNSGSDAAFSAQTLRQKPQSYWGSSWRQPMTIGDKMLFVTANETYVRSLGYEITLDGYKGTDMTIFAPHLFKDYALKDWAQSLSPDPQITCVRADGYACNLTFNPDQEVTAWSRWKTDGKFLAVAATRPSADDVDTAPYFVVERKVNGATVHYVERLASRRFADVRDAFFVDSGLSYDAPIEITGVTGYPIAIEAPGHGLSAGEEIEISGIIWEPSVDALFNETQPDQLNNRRYLVADVTTDTFKLVKASGRRDITLIQSEIANGWPSASPEAVYALSHGFAVDQFVGVFNVGGTTEINGLLWKVNYVPSADEFLISDEDGTEAGTGWSAYTSGGQVYAAEDGLGFNAYSSGGSIRRPASTISGLWHLEGRSVVALADGNVVSRLTVQNGAVTLPRKFARVHVGLRYVADIETLNPEKGGGTLQGKQQRVPQVSVRMKDSRGLLIGPDGMNLREMKQREYEALGEPTALLTGDKKITVTATWNGGGRIFIRQPNPLPLTVLSVASELDEGGDEEG